MSGRFGGLLGGSARPADLAPLIEESIVIDTSPERVWTLVSDLRNMARWSPQVAPTLVLGPAANGTRAVNLNRRGLLMWPTRTRIVRYEPPTTFAFRVTDNKALWSYELSPTDTGGTRVVERRAMPDGTTGVSHTLISRLLGGQPAFADELREGMAQTLAGLKRDAEN